MNPILSKISFLIFDFIFSSQLDFVILNFIYLAEKTVPRKKVMMFSFKNIIFLFYLLFMINSTVIDKNHVDTIFPVTF